MSCAFDPAEGAKVHQDLREAIYKLGALGAVKRTAALILETAKEKK